MYLRPIILLIATVLSASIAVAQQAPSQEENIPFLCTFSKAADKSWGDDDNVQIIFFVMPATEKNPIYIKIFDPNNGGKHDEGHGPFNSKTRFSVYGGLGAHSNPDAKKHDPEGNFKSGVQLASKTFDADMAYDDKWFSLGPFNPVEGEMQPDVGGYVFKVVIEGLDGDDGNLYRLFLSSDKTDNKPIEGGNMFTYEYSFRLSDVKNSVSHLYPFITSNLVAVKVNIFDFDNDGMVRLVSVAKRGDIAKVSGDAEWTVNTHEVIAQEYNTSFDIQFIKQKEAKNNNIVVFITNQYNQLMPFYTSPIGGIPKYKYKIGVKVNN
ncbi:MAG: hypothetical protein JWO09_2256 [Bacteroidetes bacterium]|nr:hypothetical protein [Bacteroidota bacterium]